MLVDFDVREQKGIYWCVIIDYGLLFDQKRRFIVKTP